MYHHVDGCGPEKQRKNLPSATTGSGARTTGLYCFMHINSRIPLWSELKLYGGIGSSETMGRVVGDGREKLKLEAILPPASVRAAS